MIWVYFCLFFSIADSVTKELITTAANMGFSETLLQKGEKNRTTLNWMLGKGIKWLAWDPGRSPDCSASPVPRLGAPRGPQPSPRPLSNRGSQGQPGPRRGEERSLEAHTSPHFPLKSFVQQFPLTGQTFAPEWADSGLNVTI